MPGKRDQKDPPMPSNTPAEPEEPPTTGGGLQTTVAVFGMSLIAMVVGTALYGTPEQSRRAFQLLQWWKRDPEPTASADEQSPRSMRR